MILNYRIWLFNRLSLLLSLTFSKVSNFLLIIISWGASIITRKCFLWAGPFSLSFESSAICNLRCPECATGTKQTQRNRKLGDPVFLENQLWKHRKHAFYCNLFFQGEPFLNPHIFQIIRLTGKYNYYSVISTNGHFLDEENCSQIIRSKLNHIIISLDGLDQQSFSQYRIGGYISKVTEGIKRLASMREDMRSNYPLIEVQFLVNKTNEQQIKKAPGFAKKLGADLFTFKSMQIISNEGAALFLPSDKQFNRYYRNKRKNKHRNCFRLWSHMVYTSDGLLVPCCYDKIPHYAMSLSDDEVMNSWKSDAFMQFRNNVLKNINTPGICSNCAG
jgi:MoaA/NifB/PqqE/SkfB family radical SAM enzyme